ncbi:hypothetical protein ACFO4N_14095 [Camelliibacillus cellulosilyticus]|uniref:Spore coat protein n=1 Tax=Camelliibacillus cellulosilyticus TaxID=2174486 RepID=A0ABV9GQH2_9BACL
MNTNNDHYAVPYGTEGQSTGYGDVNDVSGPSGQAVRQAAPSYPMSSAQTGYSDYQNQRIWPSGMGGFGSYGGWPGGMYGGYPGGGMYGGYPGGFYGGYPGMYGGGYPGGGWYGGYPGGAWHGGGYHGGWHDGYPYWHGGYGGHMGYPWMPYAGTRFD